MRILRLLAAFVLTAGLIYLPAQKPACACSCAVLSPAEHFGYADLVFTGVTTKAEYPVKDQSGTEPVKFTFRVEQVEKGQAAADVVVTSTRESASCGMAFAMGTRYRIYARGNTTGLCSGNVTLGVSSDPLPTPEPTKSAGGNVSTSEVGVVVFAALSAVIAYLLYRKLRRPEDRTNAGDPEGAGNDEPRAG